MKLITSKSKLEQIRKQYNILEEDFSDVTGAKIQGKNDTHGVQVFLTEDINPTLESEFDLIDYWL